MVVGSASALAALHLDPRFRGNDRTGAAGCCREFEGVPQFSFCSIPQEWGIKGVEEIVIASHSPERARRRRGSLFVLLASPPWDCFGSVASRNDTLVPERRAG